MHFKQKSFKENPEDNSLFIFISVPVYIRSVCGGISIYKCAYTLFIHIEVCVYVSSREHLRKNRSRRGRRQKVIKDQKSLFNDCLQFSILAV